jgi:hypothetical protein
VKKIARQGEEFYLETGSGTKTTRAGQLVTDCLSSFRYALEGIEVGFGRRRQVHESSSPSGGRRLGGKKALEVQKLRKGTVPEGTVLFGRIKPRKSLKRQTGMIVVTSHGSLSGGSRP